MRATDQSALDFTVLLKHNDMMFDDAHQTEDENLLDDGATFRLAEDSCFGITPARPRPQLSESTRDGTAARSRKRPRISLELAASSSLAPPAQQAKTGVTVKTMKQRPSHILPQDHPAHARSSFAPAPPASTTTQSLGEALFERVTQLSVPASAIRPLILVEDEEEEEDLWAVTAPPQAEKPVVAPAPVAKGPSIRTHEARKRPSRIAETISRQKNDAARPKMRVSSTIACRADDLKRAFSRHSILPPPSRAPVSTTRKSNAASTSSSSSSRSSEPTAKKTTTTIQTKTGSGGLTLMHEFDFSNRHAERESERQRRRRERERGEEMEQRVAETLRQARESAWAREKESIPAAPAPASRPVTADQMRPFRFATDLRIQAHARRERGGDGDGDKENGGGGADDIRAAASRLVLSQRSEWHERQKKREAEVRARREALEKQDQTAERDKLAKLRKALAPRNGTLAPLR